MMAEIEQRRSEFEDLARRFGVKRLKLFGSAATGDFRQRHKRS
jgi:predicted nucleotidyltransferase